MREHSHIENDSLSSSQPDTKQDQIASTAPTVRQAESAYHSLDLDEQAENEEAPDILTRDSPLPAPQLAFETSQGRIYCGDSLQLLNNSEIILSGSVNLIMTSPPFGLVRKKEYGNVDADKYTEWFRPFAEACYNVLSDSGSLVIDIGGAWIPGQPTRSLYHYELLIMLCREYKFHLAQEFHWWNPSKLPTPAEWVNVRRIRVKDAVNCVWWLSKTPWPKASNTRVLQPYSDSMMDLLKNGYKAKLRPSGHDISTKFSVDNGASIPPNILAIPNTESNSAYLRYCAEHNLKMHPARYPAALPEYFIRMLTDPGDLVIDPFAGSCVTGEVSERLNRRWICVELREDYVEGARGRFIIKEEKASSPASGNNAEKFYQLARPGLLWNGNDEPPLPEDGGRTRPKKLSEPAQKNSPGHDAQSNETASTEDIATYTPSLKETRSPICEQESLW
jgi:site-specific DNA-methyltransferase (cytosine-N4-specific)